MDKRFFLALILTALVIVVTPMIFPSPRRPSASDTSSVTAVATPAETGTVAPPATPGPTPSGSTIGPTELLNTSPAPVAAETTTVVTPHATYRLSSRGAVPISAEMHDYQALSRQGVRIIKGDRVELVPPGEALLGYRIISPSDTISLDEVAFTVSEDSTAEGKRVTYTGQSGTAQITITYAFSTDSRSGYTANVSGTVVGVSSPAYLLIELPETLRSAEADTAEDRNHLAYAYKPTTDGASSIPIGKLDFGQRRLAPGPHAWVAAKSKYFLVALLTPEGGEPFTELSATGTLPDSVDYRARAQATAIKALGAGNFAFELYVGPQEWRRLIAMGRDLENVNPYGGFMQGIVQPFATAVMQLLLWIKERTQLNYGWVLIIFGVAIRILLWPLNQRAMRSTMKMSAIQPEMAAIQKRYKEDPAKLQSEMIKLYKEHGVSPFSMFSGCLPMLLPMPFLIALFFVFQNTIEFRGVSFLWLPDISVKDPFYILPLAMGVSMFLLSWIGMKGQAPNPQAKMMAYIFPPMMTILFLNFASGLNLYYTVQNLAALPQQWLIARERQRMPKPVPRTP